ncbi:MAG: glycosyltransferase family 4 protein [Tateyamaria sp.]|uniref:glycosyltransferase family 4 protein n=1 Tax=Tateyamaria sp. TaxID=1929288 RepID=UPI00329B042B
MARRPRVLVIAEAANPEWVSVPLVGWSLAQALRTQADVHLVTQIRNREAILRAGLQEGQDFTAIDSERLARPLWRVASVLRMGQGKGWTMTTAINAIVYPYFERLVWQRFGAEIKAGAYDIIHRVTPLSPTASSPIARRCVQAGVPFVMGPLNGGVPWPAGFDRARRQEREWLSYVRDAYKLMPGRQSTLKAARAILAGSRHTQSEIPAAFQDKTVYLPENAIDPERFNMVAKQSLERPLRACFVGRMVPYKGPDMLLEALAPLLKHGHLHLDMIGDGPMRAALETQAQAAGCADQVTFHGAVPHERVQDIMVQANLLTFPSIREFGGGVVLEAMALGIVPVVINYAGPGELVQPSFGNKIPIGTREEIISSLRAEVQAVVQDPTELPWRAEAARKHAHSHFTWGAKALQIRRLYDAILAGQPLEDPIQQGV